MSEREWESRYQQKELSDIPQPALLLQQNSRLLTGGGNALDIAMGMGHNAVYLASRGYRVTGVDRAGPAITLAEKHAELQGVTLNAVEADMLVFPIEENSYDLIINFYFLERSLLGAIQKGLKQNGLLFFETYTVEQPRFGPPHNPDHLLEKNELIESFLGLFILFYHERIQNGKAIASLIARKV